MTNGKAKSGSRCGWVMGTQPLIVRVRYECVLGGHPSCEAESYCRRLGEGGGKLVAVEL